MIVQVEIPIGGSRLSVTKSPDLPVRDFSVGEIGRLTRCEFVPDGRVPHGEKLVATLELDEDKLRARLAEKRHVF